ncbi:MAG: DUF2254 domain-containing protein [Planctomycetota bacterium]|nr:MAG: DUF2254 domain-containing protein [Planctomycetota bacterium]
MYTRIINRWDRVRNSFWFIPGALSLAGIGLALGSTWLRGPAASWIVDLFPWIAVSTSAARASLATISSAMVSIVGIVFSVTLVTLSIASSQYGSRLLRTFMSDTFTQVALGLLIGTSLFCMVALTRIEPSTDDKSVPNVSILIGLGMAVGSMAILIGYIHHVANLIQAPSVVAAVAADLNESLARLFPASAEEEETEQPEPFELPQAARGAPVRSAHEGYLQAIDLEGLISICKADDLVARLLVKPGEFIEIGLPLVEVWPGEAVLKRDHSEPDPSTTKSRDFGDEFAERINDCFIAGTRRTPRQDAECALDELVEVAVRALSPGINDPFTAISCLDRLSAVLGRIAERKMPDPVRRDDEGVPRIVARSTTFDDLMDAAFHQIRQFGCSCPAVAIHMMIVLTRIARHCDSAESRRAVRRHADLLQHDFRQHVEQPEDGDDFQLRYEELQEVLGKLSGTDGTSAE